MSGRQNFGIGHLLRVESSIAVSVHVPSSLPPPVIIVSSVTAIREGFQESDLFSNLGEMKYRIRGVVFLPFFLFVSRKLKWTRKKKKKKKKKKRRGMESSDSEYQIIQESRCTKYQVQTTIAWGN